MVDRFRYETGEPCWADVTAVDVPGAQEFYGAVFGWTFTPADAGLGGYVTCLLGDRRVAGISPPPPGDVHLSPAWSVYLASHDLDDTAARASKAGGTVVLGPIEIPSNGRMLFGFDPTGAAFGSWEPGPLSGLQAYREPGALTWAELNTREPIAADSFYRALFGYHQLPIGVGSDYTAWSLHGDEPVCGRLLMTDDWAGISPHWMAYFEVTDADTAIDHALTTGGTVTMGPFDSPHGRVAVLADPGGAVFTILSH